MTATVTVVAFTVSSPGRYAITGRRRRSVSALRAIASVGGGFRDRDETSDAATDQHSEKCHNSQLHRYLLRYWLKRMTGKLPRQVAAGLRRPASVSYENSHRTLRVSSSLPRRTAISGCGLRKAAPHPPEPLGARLRVTTGLAQSRPTS
jgi:hypothetical protein